MVNQECPWSPWRASRRTGRMVWSTRHLPPVNVQSSPNSVSRILNVRNGEGGWSHRVRFGVPVGSVSRVPGRQVVQVVLPRVSCVPPSVVTPPRAQNCAPRQEGRKVPNGKCPAACRSSLRWACVRGWGHNVNVRLPCCTPSCSSKNVPPQMDGERRWVPGRIVVARGRRRKRAAPAHIPPLNAQRAKLRGGTVTKRNARGPGETWRRH